MWPVHHCIPHAECEFGFLRFSVSPMGDSYALQVENQECRHVTGYEEKERIRVFPVGSAVLLPPREFPLILQSSDGVSSALLKTF